MLNHDYTERAERNIIIIIIYISNRLHLITGKLKKYDRVKNIKKNKYMNYKF